ncbi:hypothetical protein MBAV_003004 [Candidatus Magnetobacterium bavaricum]|uniref:Uncharacterized protein n=1 Tax=Candidatus Magnetobacterium bavaricum TaxID=29290 RepID=A0A0F3GS62_9BACT|nr:hypothetical protein MBAV_003004 [Candidatus Magnetobacterium bavaricum]
MSELGLHRLKDLQEKNNKACLNINPDNPNCRTAPYSRRAVKLNLLPTVADVVQTSLIAEIGMRHCQVNSYDN